MFNRRLQNTLGAMLVFEQRKRKVGFPNNVVKVISDARQHSIIAHNPYILYKPLRDDMTCFVDCIGK